MARVENNPKEIAKVMNELLCGRYFEGYEFSTSFVLKTFSNRWVIRYLWRRGIFYKYSVVGLGGIICKTSGVYIHGF